MSCACARVDRDPGYNTAELAPPVTHAPTLRLLDRGATLPALRFGPRCDQADLDAAVSAWQPLRTADDLDCHLAQRAAWQAEITLPTAPGAWQRGPARDKGKGPGDDGTAHLLTCMERWHERLAYATDVTPYIDEALYAGMNELMGYILGDPNPCGWVFQGYALPLVDDPAHRTWWDIGFCGLPAGGWAPNLPFHVHTTSTSTVYLDTECVWRLYFPTPTLVQDDKADISSTSYPDYHPNDTGHVGIAYPAPADWEAQPRFNRNYLAFVDSPDEGETFPVYGPRMIADRGGLYGSSVMCTTTWNPTWDRAGWTCTAIPTQAGTSGGSYYKDSKGHTYKFRDITIVDLRKQIGWCVAVGVECRSAGSNPGDLCCTTANTAATMCDPDCDFPYTRVVVFGCEDADFQDVYPRPTVADGEDRQVIVLVKPDLGADGPNIDPTATGCTTSADPNYTTNPYNANEWYGVPTALLDDTGTLLLVYVPWTGREYGTPLANPFRPSRVTELYVNDGSYRESSEPPTPLWTNANSGISCFAIPLTFISYLMELQKQKTDGTVSGIGDSVFEELTPQSVGLYYEGEVLASTGGKFRREPFDSVGDDPEPGFIPVPDSIVDIVDPHWLYVDGQLTMYWDKNHVGATGSTSNDQVLSAHSATVSDLNAVEGGHFGFAMRLNGPHSIFLQTETCEKMAFDMRGMFTPLPWDEDRWSTLDHGRLASDPDVVQLADGRLRINLSGGGEKSKGSEGLIYAITSAAVQAIEEQGR